jgi:hypothetical protein
LKATNNVFYIYYKTSILTLFHEDTFKTDDHPQPSARYYTLAA